jgi:hypothetical protein
MQSVGGNSEILMFNQMAYIAIIVLQRAMLANIPSVFYTKLSVYSYRLKY